LSIARLPRVDTLPLVPACRDGWQKAYRAE
jgi:hypothetical protein